MQNETTDRALQAQKNGAEIMKIAHKYGITVFDVLDISDALKSLPPVYDSEKDALATARAEGAQEERKKHIEIYRWLVGYYDFPERQDGMGAYWWRSHLMDKLKNIGIEALTTKEHHAE